MMKHGVNPTWEYLFNYLDITFMGRYKGTQNFARVYRILCEDLVVCPSENYEKIIIFRQSAVPNSSQIS